VTHLAHLVHVVHLIDLMQLVDLIELLQGRVVIDAGLHGGSGSGGGGDMLFVPATRVGVAVDAGVSRQLVGSTETFCTAGKLTGVWFLPRVGANVSGLMFEAVESLVAQGTLVWAR
jgi:hypothetical protein